MFQTDFKSEKGTSFRFQVQNIPNVVKRTLHKERPYKICKHTALTYGHVAFG